MYWTARCRLVEKGTGMDWAGAGHPIGEFVYRTYTQAQDFDRYVCQYTPGFCGDGKTNGSADAEGLFWRWQPHARTRGSD